MSYEYIGKLVAIYETVQRTDTFKTREFAVEKTDDINGKTFTSYAKFQAVQDKTMLVDNLNIGDEVKVYFNIKGSKWEKDGKTNYITNLDAWRVEVITGATTQIARPAPASMEGFAAPDIQTTDDLPF